MCGRFIVAHPPRELLAQLGVAAPANLAPRYNIAPSQPVLTVVRRKDGALEARDLKWGLVPWWAQDPKIGARLINARAESVREKPAFRDAFLHGRCIVPATGFYEWRKDGKARWPLLYRRDDGAAFGLAALWDRWRTPDGGTLETVVVLTVPANPLVSPVHDRMPALLDAEACKRWLDPRTSPDDALALLAPAPPEPYVFYPVSPEVNRPDFDDPRALEALTRLL